MAVDEVFLRHTYQANLDIGSLGVVYVNEGVDSAPPEVVLFVKDDAEHDFTLHPGDTFPIGNQTWKLDRIENPGGQDWTVVLSRVE